MFAIFYHIFTTINHSIVLRRYKWDNGGRPTSPKGVETKRFCLIFPTG